MVVSQIEKAEVHLVQHIQNGLEPGASVWKSRRDLGHFQSFLGFLILHLLIWWSAEHPSGAWMIQI